MDINSRNFSEKFITVYRLTMMYAATMVTGSTLLALAMILVKTGSSMSSNKDWTMMLM